MISKNEVKYIRSLGQQKGRLESGTFLAEGAKIITELILYCPERIEKIYATSHFIRDNQHLVTSIPFTEVDMDMLGRLSLMQVPNQALAVVKKFDVPLPALDSKEWMLLLDGIQDPGNLGTIIREADWFGIKHILCTRDTVDCYNNKVVQASMGSVLRVGVHKIEVDWIHRYKGPVLGTMLEGEPIHKFSFPPYGLFVIGREGSGIRDEIRSVLTHSVSIPSYGHAESLNAAVAAGILLWEWRRGQ
jgi:TrmH family RNA methyltransferase